MKQLKSWLAVVLLTPVLVLAAGGETFPNKPFAGDMHNSDSVLNGAKLYTNYCLGCHSLKFQRYNRLAADMQVSDEQVKKYLIPNGADVRGPMLSSISPSQAQEWFGKTPPDLSLTARAKGQQYIYNYLLGFYQDSSRATGYNNSVFPLVGMPHVLASLEGEKTPIIHEEKIVNSETKDITIQNHITGFNYIAGTGTLSPEKYENTVYDLSNFLYYVSDPSKIKRDQLGWKVLLYLALMTVVFYFLKKAFWRNIH